MTATAIATIHRGVHPTPLGKMVSTWTESGLRSLRWEEPSPGSFDSGSSDVRCDDLDARLQEYFQTGRVDFGSIEVDSEGWTAFTETVYECCRAIEPGTTLTYKELAGRAGNPAASRAVGAAMSRNRVLLVIPCHRVISAGGELRGFSAAGGLQTKQSLLDLERA